MWGARGGHKGGLNGEIGQGKELFHELQELDTNLEGWRSLKSASGQFGGQLMAWNEKVNLRFQCNKWG